MHEVRDVGPKRLIAGLELDGGAEAFMLDVEPERVESLSGELAASPFGVHVALESIERNLTHDGIDHVLDLGCEHGLALLLVRTGQQLPEGEHFSEYARGLGER